MTNSKNIVAFIDVQNCGIDFERYQLIMDQLEGLGNLCRVVLYGVNERRNKQIILDASAKGFEMILIGNRKKRVSKDVDHRIAVDCMQSLYAMAKLDRVAIVSNAKDLVYLYSAIKKKGVEVIAPDNCDEFSSALINAVIDIGEVEIIKAPKKAVKKVAKAEPKEVKAEPVAEKAPAVSFDDLADQVADQVAERLAGRFAEKAEPEAKPVVAEKATLADEAESLQQLADLMADKKVAQPAPAEKPNDDDAMNASSDADLLDRIQQIRDNSQGSNEDQVVDKLFAMLKEFDD